MSTFYITPRPYDFSELVAECAALGWSIGPGEHENDFRLSDGVNVIWLQNCRDGHPTFTRYGGNDPTTLVEAFGLWSEHDDEYSAWRDARYDENGELRVTDFTVAFVIDAARSVVAFVEYVEGTNRDDAFRAAVEQARSSDKTSSGYPIAPDEWDAARLILTVPGNHLPEPSDG